MPDRHYLSPLDMTADEREHVLARALQLKSARTPGERSRLRVGSLFLNPSLRTRISMEQAAWILGAQYQSLNAAVDGWKMEMDPSAVMDRDTVENIVEAARVLGRYFDVLGIRAFPGSGNWDEERAEPTLRAFAEHSGTTVLSLEGAMHHPCQSLADVLTMREHFGTDLRGLRVVMRWAWHPRALPMAVSNSFALQAALAGCRLTICHPEGYDLDPEVMEQVRAAAGAHGQEVRVSHDVERGHAGAKVLYVKSWGRLDLWSDPEAEAAQRVKLRHWIADAGALAATDDARVMHCLPTRRNVEIAGDVLDSDRSLVVEQAENRLWAQAALIELLAKSKGVI
ncbi:MAG: N-acetylornithine carbamoyltransferase [Fimbriimonadaceae bacterium]